MVRQHLLRMVIAASAALVPPAGGKAASAQTGYKSPPAGRLLGNVRPPAVATFEPALQFAPPTADGTVVPLRPFSSRLEEGRGLLGGLLAPFSAEPEGRDDQDDPLVTDRPSFTPSNVPVSRGRLVIESGYTFTHDLTADTEVNEHLFPELGFRYGLCDKAELRVVWIGQTYSDRRPRAGGTIRRLAGVADTEISIGWEVSEQHRLVPQAMLITGLLAPTGGGGSSPFSGGGVQPLAILSYGWNLGERFSIAGSTGYSTLRRVDPDLMNASDNFQQFAQSLIASWAVTERTTLFHEWFVLARVNSVDDRPENYMQTGALFMVTPNVQLDARVGMGLGDYTADFFTGAGLSIRY